MFPYRDDTFLMRMPRISQEIFGREMFPSWRLFNAINCPSASISHLRQTMDEFFRQASRTFFFEPSNGGYPANLNICSIGGNNIPICRPRRRLQAHESNTRRHASQPPAQFQPSRRAIHYLDQLPITTVRVREVIQQRAIDNNHSSCPSTSGLPDPEPCDTTTGSSEAPSTQTKLPAFTEYTLVIDRKAANRMRHLIPLQPLCVGPNGRKPECDICLSEYESGHKLRHLPCGHGFHQKCIDTWLSSADTCPKCRKNVVGTLRRLESAETRLRSQSKGRPLPASMRQPPASRATSAAGNTGDSVSSK
uniref:RING-type domain-containing protein n=1 Tax=Mesocestoides corti TaxID=53468 RepID=A0A5K3EZH0_MESCO